MSKTIAFEIGGDGTVRGIVSGAAESKFVGWSKSLMPAPAPANGGQADPFDELARGMNTFVSDQGGGSRVVVVLPEIGGEQQARSVAENLRARGVLVEAVIGRAAIANEIAKGTSPSVHSETWLLDAAADSLLIWKLREPTDPQRIEFSYSDLASRQRGIVRGAFRDFAKKDLQELGGTSGELERWLDANWQTIWSGAGAVAWTAGGEAGAEIEARQLLDRLRPQCEQRVKAVADACASLDHEGVQLFVSDALTRRCGVIESLKSDLPKAKVEVLSSTRVLACVQAWQGRERAAGPDCTIWATTRFEEAGKITWVSPTKDDGRLVRLERANKHLAIAAAVLFVLVLISLFWRPEVRTSVASGLTKGDDSELQARIKKLEQDLVDLRAVKQSTVALDAQVRALETNVNNQARAVSSVDSRLNEQVKLLSDRLKEASGRSADSKPTTLKATQLIIVDADGRERTMIGAGILRCFTESGKKFLDLDDAGLWMTDEEGNETINLLNRTGLISLTRPDKKFRSLLSPVELTLGGLERDKFKMRCNFGIDSDEDGGYLQIVNSSEQKLVGIYGKKVPDVQLFAANGKLVLRATEDSDGGALTLSNPKTGKNMFTLWGSGNSGHPLLQIYDSKGNSVLELGTTTIKGSSHGYMAGFESGRSRGPRWPSNDQVE